MKKIICFFPVLICFLIYSNFNNFVSADNSSNFPTFKFGDYNYTAFDNWEYKSDFTSVRIKDYFESNVKSIDENKYFYLFSVGIYTTSYNAYILNVQVFDRSQITDNTLSIYSNGYFDVEPAFCGKYELWLDDDFKKIDGIRKISDDSRFGIYNYPTASEGGTYNKTCAYMANIPMLNVDGDDFNTGNAFNITYTVEKNLDCIVTFESFFDDKSKGHLTIYNNKTEQPAEANRIPYKPVESQFTEFSKGKKGTIKFNLKEFRDTCQDYKVFTSKIIIEAWITGPDDMHEDKFFTIDLDHPFDNDNDNDESGGLFSKKKDYIPLPDINKYIKGFDEFPNIHDYIKFSDFDSTDSFIDQLTGIVFFCFEAVQFYCYI